MNRGKDVILDDSLADQDRVFEVVTVPGHEGDQHVAAERQFAAARAGAVGNDLAFLHRVALADENLLVDARGRVRAHEFADVIDVNAFLRGVPDLLLALGQFAVLREDDLIAGDGRDSAALFGRNHGAGVARHTFFQPRRDQRRFGDDQRHRLALHVRAHQRAVGVVVLQKGNQASGDRHQLFGRDVHVIHSRRFNVDEIAFATAGHAVGEEVAPVVDLRVGLRDDKRLLAVGGEVFEVSRHSAFLHLAVRRFNETKVVDARERGQRRDQADVRPFRRFDRANASVVGRMHVAHLEPGAVAGQAARPQRGEAPLVRQFGQRIDLVHELRKLAASEKIADHGRQRLGIDQFLRSHRLDALVEQGHALLHQTFGAGQPDTALVGQQFTHRAHAPAAQMIDVVQAAFALFQPEQVFGGSHQIFLG